MHWVIKALLPRALGWDTMPLGALVSPSIKWVQSSLSWFTLARPMPHKPLTEGVGRWKQSRPQLPTHVPQPHKQQAPSGLTACR